MRKFERCDSDVIKDQPNSKKNYGDLEVPAAVNIFSQRRGILGAFYCVI